MYNTWVEHGKILISIEYSLNKHLYVKIILLYKKKIAIQLFNYRYLSKI